MPLRTAVALVLALLGAAVAWPRAGHAGEGASDPEALRRPDSIDEAMWRRLKRLDERAAEIHSFTAAFRQEKHPTFLEEPIASRGRIRLKGDRMRWDTKGEQPTRMLVTPTRLRIYYPKQELLEIYPADERFGGVVASPVPRLRDLLSSFRMRAAPVPSGEGEEGDGEKTYGASLRLRLVPREEKAREHIQRVVVYLDETRGCAKGVRITDADGERTEIAFSEIRINPEVPDESLTLEVPEGSRPFDRRGED